MANDAQNIYDDPDFFAGYSQLNRQQIGLSGAPEWPTMQTMLPSAWSDLTVVDLGCGFGWFSRWAADKGARKVVGIDLSQRMLERAAEMTDAPAVSYRRENLEQIKLTSGTFDVAFSSLTLHYVADLPRLLQVVHRSLSPGGRFVFSVEHPIFSAPTLQQFQELEAGDRVWPLDGYLREGERSTNWFADGVIKQHRTVASYINGVADAGFVVRRIEEFGLTDDPDDAHRPWFLLVQADRGHGPNVGQDSVSPP